ncbi:alkene reductase [Burkholderia gladioli]|uniref:alkene reductase n=1 Tax=Burkholderia gladioli TaxID=28095 RepID=UPI00039CB907|nr:alkene reductase [Burkholderia gladioli]ATF89065.1 alkene reductase [Burkholderia gladioli pv. gladioli]MBJ9712502.1 alkene reductase [Burkholderia gladioli]MBU9157629.1 alkene reductase [Burkholderia gladioli]MBU9171310.1 alkene reductase [Burkholderia gladioli]MBU9198235.1 alkene reductase [Burkholderia gladioli]
MSTAELFSPAKLAGHDTAHRIVMAPMTRARSTQPGDIPNAMNARYYAQRASAALIVTEASQITPQGKGYSFTPGIHSDAQREGWRLVTDAVHAEGGRIFLQLWHVGRMSHPDFHGGELPVAPSAVPFDGQIWKVDPATGIGAMVDCPTPRELRHEEIRQIVQDFRQAARRAIEAGFDGVEIHGANGYLVDQFLRTTSNRREDEYGGSRENRLRFLQEVVDAVAAEVGAERTAIRLAPFLTARGMACPDILPTILDAAAWLQARGIAYLHLVEADWDDAPQFTESFRREIRERFARPIIVAGKYDLERANWVLANGYADFIAFGRKFVANPDLPRRLAEGLPLADFDGATLFGGDERGYSDYPALAR